MLQCLPPEHLNPQASAMFDLYRLEIICPHGSSSGRPPDSTKSDGPTSMTRSSDIVVSNQRRSRSFLTQLGWVRFVGLVYVGHLSQHHRSTRSTSFASAGRLLAVEPKMPNGCVPLLQRWGVPHHAVSKKWRNAAHPATMPYSCLLQWFDSINKSSNNNNTHH